MLDKNVLSIHMTKVSGFVNRFRDGTRADMGSVILMLNKLLSLKSLDVSLWEVWVNESQRRYVAVDSTVKCLEGL